MASHCDPHFATPRLSLWLPALVLTMTWHFSVTESAAPIQLRGEVGGNVTFHCPVAKQRTFLFLYFQRGLSFVNGYHALKNISQLTWENTRMDQDKTTIHMYNLSMSHSGDYQCHIRYSDSDNEVADTAIHLTVTATYSTPALTVDCRDENHHFSCRATCAAHGGYPGREVMWNVSGNQTLKVLNSSKRNDPDTMVVNSSSTLFINCSHGGLMSLSCSVGDITSDTISVCDKSNPTDPPDNPSPYVIAAICAVMFVSIMVALLLWWKRRKGQRRATAVAVKVNGCEEDVTMLNGIKEETEASCVINL